MLIITILSLLNIPYGILKTLIVLMLTKYNWNSIIIMLEMHLMLKSNWLTKVIQLIRYYTIIQIVLISNVCSISTNLGRYDQSMQQSIAVTFIVGNNGPMNMLNKIYIHIKYHNIPKNFINIKKKKKN